MGEATQVALEAVGLGAVMVGGMRAHATEVAEVLGLPHESFVVYGMSVGWPDGDPAAGGLKPRLPADLVIHSGHGPDTTLGRELATNPFLGYLRRERGMDGPPGIRWAPGT